MSFLARLTPRLAVVLMVPAAAPELRQHSGLASVLDKITPLSSPRSRIPI